MLDGFVNPPVGYEGKPKGVLQMLWERGLWEEGTTGRPDPKSGKNRYTVLGSCPDFRAEKVHAAARGREPWAHPRRVTEVSS